MRKHKHAHTHDTSTVLKEAWLRTNFVFNIYLCLTFQGSEDEGTARMWVLSSCVSRLGMHDNRTTGESADKNQCH